MGSRRVFLLVVTGWLCACAVEESAPVRTESRAAGTRRMAERLALLARDAHPLTNVYRNRQRAEYFEALAPGDRGERSPRAELQIAREWLLAGETERAIERLEALRDRLRAERPAPGLEHDVRWLVAVAYLRLGEQENCIEGHASESCLLPISGGGVHRRPRGSRAAMRQLEGLLQEDPDDLEALWLLNLAAMTLGEYPQAVPAQWRIPPQQFASDGELPRFPDLAAAAGLAVVGACGGSVVEDFDGDGYLDVMASSWGPTDQLRYFHNQADGGFVERTAAAGLEGIVGGLNLVHADYDNDGDADVFVLRGAWLGRGGHQPNSLLRNNGDGSFEDVTEEAGVLSFRATQTAAWGDYDNDGWLDLYVGNESLPADPAVGELYRNNRDGTFREVAAATGTDVGGYVKAALWGDVDNDGWPDLYLSRMLEPNLLLHNEGGEDPVFTDVTELAGVGEPLHSFPGWFWDYDNDGWLDLFVSGYGSDYLATGAAEVAAEYLGRPTLAEKPRLYHNRGDGTFDDVTADAGLWKVLYSMGANYGDLDNDGWPDFYLGTGAPSFSALMPNRMFRNRNGQAFVDVTVSGGFGHLQKGHGVSFADLDNDGDQDIYTVIGGAYEGDVYPNALFVNPGNTNHWITLRLEGVQANRSAIGARVRVALETPRGRRDVRALVGTGGSFGSSSLQQEIGLGDATSIVEIEVVWPGSGTPQLVPGPELDQIVRLRQGDPRAVPVHLRPLPLGAPAAGHVHPS